MFNFDEKIIEAKEQDKKYIHTKNGQHVQCDPKLIDYIDQKKIIQTEGAFFTRYINHIIS